jgi:hypothetical protein
MRRKQPGGGHYRSRHNIDADEDGDLFDEGDYDDADPLFIDDYGAPRNIVNQVRDAFNVACAFGYQGRTTESDGGYWKAIYTIESHPILVIENAIIAALLDAKTDAIAGACNVMDDLPMIPGLVIALDRAIRTPSTATRRAPLTALLACLANAGLLNS